MAAIKGRLSALEDGPDDGFRDDDVKIDGVKADDVEADDINVGMTTVDDSTGLSIAATLLIAVTPSGGNSSSWA